MSTGAAPDATALAADRRRRAWLVGGGLLIAHAGVVAASASLTSFLPGLVVSLAAAALLLGSMLVFAFGLHGEGSVVARRPTGVVALVVVGVWPLAAMTAWSLVPVPATIPPPAAVDILFWVSTIVPLAAALVAVVQIARSGAVPRAWRWAPAGGLAILVLAELIAQVVVSQAAPLGGQQLALAAYGIVQLVRVAVPCALGVLAVVLSTRIVPARTVQVYPEA